MARLAVKIEPVGDKWRVTCECGASHEYDKQTDAIGARENHLLLAHIHLSTIYPNGYLNVGVPR